VRERSGRPRGPTQGAHWTDLDPDYAACNAGKAQSPESKLKPAGLVLQDTAYYLDMGSLTNPLCREGIAWFVLKTRVEISAEEISAFAKLYPHDVRPPQPLNGRVVKESR